MSCLARRGVEVDELCPICHREPKTIIHAIGDCDWVKGVWMQLGVSISNQEFWMNNLQDWINLNGKVKCSRAQEKPPWKITFSFAVWCIWLNQNMDVFKGKRVNHNMSKDILNQVLEFIYCVHSPRSSNQKINRSIHGKGRRWVGRNLILMVHG